MTNVHTCLQCGAPFSRPRPDANRMKHCSERCRFLAKVETSGPDQCWEWRAGRFATGYGAFRTADGKVGYAHRLAWTIANGAIPDGMSVLHRCDNPPCCNPAHLFIGTNSDNMADMSVKGRHGMLGKTHSPEIRAKIVAGRAANPPSRTEKWRSAIQRANAELWRDPAHREAMSKRMSGANNPNAGPMSAKRRAAYADYWASMKGKRRGS